MATTALTLRYRTRRAHKGSSPGEIAARCAQRPRQADHAGDGEGADAGRAQIACVEREQCRDLRAGGVAHQEQAIRVAAILVDVRASPGTGGCSIVHEGRKADLRVLSTQRKNVPLLRNIEMSPGGAGQSVSFPAFAERFRAGWRGQAPKPRSGAPQAPGLMPSLRPETIEAAGLRAATSASRCASSVFSSMAASGTG